MPLLRRCAALSLFLSVSVLRAEDQNLRARAVALLNRALLVSSLPHDLNVVTTVSFTAVTNGGEAVSGSYVRTRSSEGDLRQDIGFGSFATSLIEKRGEVYSVGNWYYQPYPVRALKRFVPYSPIRFDETDVIQSIGEAQSEGHPAICVDFVTVQGEQRSPGSLCVSKADGSVLEWHDTRRSWTATAYTKVEGALLPSEFTYQEGDSLLLKAEVRFEVLEAAPVEAFVGIEHWDKGYSCERWHTSVAIATPQPEAKGGPDAPIERVEIQAFISDAGKVEHAEVLRSSRPDLNAEAIRTVLAWSFRPATCDGVPHSEALRATIRFQGR